jgi:hypothetical protein
VSPGSNWGRWDGQGEANGALSKGQRFESALLGAQAAGVTEDFRREVQKHLKGREAEAWELLYFRLYKNQLAMIEHMLQYPQTGWMALLILEGARKPADPSRGVADPPRPGHIRECDGTLLAVRHIVAPACSGPHLAALNLSLAPIGVVTVEVFQVFSSSSFL